ncbi:hypothetical protein OG410_41620 [Streptomyces sp. NBC_00659]|uniref:hypothetical protein n=1 Tax=Streptomyces sp. NBC_00659 TaxID=2903669 RepID=UPI002E3599AE|nr:hypothetical protein [Streptomyces sp. NBC_00659]
MTFLTACDILPAEQRPYSEVYNRISAARGARTAPPPARRRPASRTRLFPLPVEGRRDRYALTGAAATPGRELFDDQVVQILLPVLQKLARAEAHRNGTAVSPRAIAASSGTGTRGPLCGPDVRILLTRILLHHCGTGRPSMLVLRTPGALYLATPPAPVREKPRGAAALRTPSSAGRGYSGCTA